MEVPDGSDGASEKGKPLRTAKRKHPAMVIFTSGPAHEFRTAVVGLVGDEAAYLPVAQTSDGDSLFVVHGTDGWGLLFEKRETPDQDIWVHEIEFRPVRTRAANAWSPWQVRVMLSGHSWDPGLHAELTGDRSIAKMSSKKRRVAIAARTAEIARLRDCFSWTMAGEALVSSRVFGVNVNDAVQKAAEKLRALSDAGVYEEPLPPLDASGRATT